MPSDRRPKPFLNTEVTKIFFQWCGGYSLPCLPGSLADASIGFWTLGEQQNHLTVDQIPAWFTGASPVCPTTFSDRICRVIKKLTFQSPLSWWRDGDPKLSPRNHFELEQSTRCVGLPLVNQHTETPAKTSEVCLQSTVLKPRQGHTDTLTGPERHSGDRQFLLEHPSTPRLYR